jgi:hypothetical protein
LIKRLQPRVEGKHPKETLFCADTRADLKAARALAATGYYNFEMALWWARKALASNDPDQISVAAVHCQIFERNGDKLREAYAAKKRQRYGGTKRGRQQKEEGAAKWKPYVDEYNLGGYAIPQGAPAD